MLASRRRGRRGPPYTKGHRIEDLQLVHGSGLTVAIQSFATKIAGASITGTSTTVTH